jgi:hypothetical protein
LGVEPAASLPADDLSLTMPLSAYQPTALPVVETASRQLTILPAPPQEPTSADSADEYPVAEEPIHAYELPSTAGCDGCRTEGAFGEDYGFEQYPDNWMWGAGGSPFRTGPGWLDDWKVGPVWDVSVDGMTLWRDAADLAAIENMAELNGAPVDDPLTRDTQFGYGGGARVYAMGKVPRSEKYQLQFGYEGVEEWNAALLFPEFDPTPMNADDSLIASRSLHYRSSMHSAEFNFYRRPERFTRPFWGFRYLRFTDEITDTIDQSSDPPVPFDPTTNSTSTDTINFFDIKNNLIGFQIGLREDTWQINRRFSLHGFLNAGVYYNRIQFANGLIESTTLLAADDPTTPADPMNDAPVDESGTFVSTSSNIASSEPTDVAYLAEASITAICRLNKSVALRGGYQMFWIDGLALAEDAYLDRPLGRHDFLMQGWHVGLEYRR